MQTVDFFTPVVDDPYDWGRITAANALSDVYAMGGYPLTALQLVGWPRDDLGFDLLERVIAGGADVMTKAGCTIVGGHSIDDREPKYGFAVTGIAPEGNVVTSAGAQAGDLLVLTKPLGTGIAATAIKRGVVPDGLVGMAIQTMATLNKAAAEAMVEAGAHAATDVTGFGLLGHLSEMLDASGVGAELQFDAIPVLPGIVLLAEDDVWPGGSQRNLDAASDVDFGNLGLPGRRVLADAQTSGGLLVSVPPGAEAPLLAIGGVVIGSITTELGIRVR